jgi:hypothetical protein
MDCIEINGTGNDSTFQRENMPQGDLILISIKTHRYLLVDLQPGKICSTDLPCIINSDV